MPSLSETVNAHIRSAAADQHTSIPARVLSYDPARQTVDVKVAINHLLPNNEVLERGAIRGVPVQFGGTTRTLISFPIKSGDSGVLIFQERSMDEWTHQAATNTASQSVFARDRRMHDYNDCVFVPGVHPYAQSPVGGRGHTYKHDPNQDVVIKHNIGTQAECYMFMKPDGSIQFQNKNVQMQLLVDGTLKIDCKDVIVNAETSIDMTTADMTITADNLTMDVAATTWTGSTVDITATIATVGVITNDGKDIGDTHTHIGSPTAPLGAISPTGVPN